MRDVYTLIDELSIEKIREAGSPERLASLGNGIFNFAQQKESEDFKISSLIDIHSKEQIIVWNRKSLVDREHHFTLTRWSEESFVLYDDMRPNGLSEGTVHAYLFGNDFAVRGLIRAMPSKRYKNIDDEISRYDLERIISRHRHPSRSSMHTTTSEVNAFCRIIKSIKQK